MEIVFIQLGKDLVNANEIISIRFERGRHGESIEDSIVDNYYNVIIRNDKPVRLTVEEGEKLIKSFVEKQLNNIDLQRR